MRKIIQIVVDSQNGDSAKNYYQDIFALCDDGSIWSRTNNEWTRLPDIPQDDVDAVAIDVIDKSCNTCKYVSKSIYREQCESCHGISGSPNWVAKKK
jgi:hypothetical protein